MVRGILLSASLGSALLVGAPTAALAAEPVPLRVETVVANAGGIVWSVAFAPEGRYFYSVRETGEIFQGRSGESPRLIVDLPSCPDCGEGGLMGLATSPNFGSDGFLYAMYTYREGSAIKNRVVRLSVGATSATVDGTVIDGIPGGLRHDGGRLGFGPDGFLYATMGDAVIDPNQAQDTSSTLGKILRLDAVAGGAASGNPESGNPYWSYGHRNPQGLDWRADGTLYSVEHGPGCRDELNRITRGGNYGWNGDSTCPPPTPPSGSIPPIKVYTETTTVAPSGATFYDSSAIPQWTGSFFFATLKDQTLYRVTLSSDGSSVVGEEQLYREQFGRLRSVAEAPDGSLWLSTDDGRILRIASAAEPGPAPVVPEVPNLALALLAASALAAGAVAIGRRRAPAA